MKRFSVGVNAFLNGLRVLVTMVFPLITFPYANKVLHIVNIGKYNFAHSVISYFVLLAGLGITTYAVREGAQYREDPDRISAFASEIFLLNLLSTLFSYICLGLVYLGVPKFHNYTALLWILSLHIALTTIGCEWLFSIFEDFFYITIRTFVLQVLYCAALFLFVKGPEDLYLYAFLTMMSNSGANLINALFLKKYCRISPFRVRPAALKKHLLPIMVIFANTVATSIYTDSDITILGFLTSDYEVGLYSFSVRIYYMVQRILSAVIIVSIPRLSMHWRTGRKEEFRLLAERVLLFLFTFMVPAMTGIMAMKREITLLLADETYLPAGTSLQILSAALVLSLFSWFFTSCILIPCQMEKRVLTATLISASVNVIGNFILIPFFKQDAAAITTVAAELISALICGYTARKLVNISIPLRDFVSVVFGSLAVYFICTKLLVRFHEGIGLTVPVMGAAAAYAVILLLAGNTAVTTCLDYLKEKITGTD